MPVSNEGASWDAWIHWLEPSHTAMVLGPLCSGLGSAWGESSPRGGVRPHLAQEISTDSSLGWASLHPHLENFPETQRRRVGDDLNLSKKLSQREGGVYEGIS